MLKIVIKVLPEVILQKWVLIKLSCTSVLVCLYTIIFVKEVAYKPTITTPIECLFENALILVFHKSHTRGLYEFLIS